ncbi:MAG: S8 family serine peptidase [Gallionella sp.]|nr:S8 family serine peptidase [Gallionella sp.]
MNRTKFISLLSAIGLGFTLSCAQAGAFNQPSGAFLPNQVLIEFKPNTSLTARNQTAQVYGAQSIRALANTSSWSIANLPAGQSVAQAVAAYASNPKVASVQPNYIYHTMAVPNDPQYGQLWAAKNNGQAITTGTYVPTTGTVANDMNLEAAWNVQTDCSSTIVAVIDSGVNYNSTDLATNMWNGGAAAPLHGWNFVGAGSNDPMDLNGHGTHVAGTIGAVANNAIGVTGVCWKASIMAVRAMDAAGAGSTASIIQSIDYAITHGAKIINMSLGGGGAFDQAFSNAITRAQNANVLVVVAAGNDNTNNDALATPSWPCNFSHANVLCVAALDQNYALANFSNWGATSVDVAAPGTNILSTWNGVHTVTNDPLTALGGGWFGSSTTALTGGGWGFGLAGPGLTVPSPWGTALYNAGTDDRAFKTFNLSGSNGATLTVSAAMNVLNGDTLNANFNAAGGDPFIAGTNIFSGTNAKDGFMSTPSPEFDISSCISANCSIGIQLLSAPASVGDIGVAITSFKIDTVTLNNTSLNTINGTSMATPEVTGIAALVWAHNPLFNYADVANAIKQGGRTLPTLVGKTNTAKAVDALGALSYIAPPNGIAVVVH